MAARSLRQGTHGSAAALQAVGFGNQSSSNWHAPWVLGMEGYIYFDSKSGFKLTSSFSVSSKLFIWKDDLGGKRRQTLKCLALSSARGYFMHFLRGALTPWHACSLACSLGSPQHSLGKDWFLVLMASIYLKKLILIHTEGWVNKSTLGARGPSEQEKHAKHFWRGPGATSCKRSLLSRSGTTAGMSTLAACTGGTMAKGMGWGSRVLPRIRGRKTLFRSPLQPKQQGAGVCESSRQVTSARAPPRVTCFEQLRSHLWMTWLFRQIYRRCPVGSPRRLPAVFPVRRQMTMTSFGRPTSAVSSGKCIPKGSVQPGKRCS